MSARVFKCWSTKKKGELPVEILLLEDVAAGFSWRPMQKELPSCAGSGKPVARFCKIHLFCLFTIVYSKWLERQSGMFCGDFALTVTAHNCQDGLFCNFDTTLFSFLLFSSCSGVAKGIHYLFFFQRVKCVLVK